MTEEHVHYEKKGQKRKLPDFLSETVLDRNQIMHGRKYCQLRMLYIAQYILEIMVK